MARVRYGARTEAEIAAARTASSRLPDIWSTGVVAVWESDPDAVAAVLPPPLKPTGRPLVRVNISKVDLPGYPLGAGSFAVAAAHDGVEGWYPLVMPMTHERALIGGREVFGEPKKLGEVTVERDGLVVHAPPSPGTASSSWRCAARSAGTAPAGADAEDRLLLQVPSGGGRFGLRRRPRTRALRAQREGAQAGADHR
jgi:hypothetical protein